jgi:dTDP-glucose 4,6-dehydratase
MNSKQIRITELNKTIEGYLMNATWCAHVKDGSYQGERLGVIKNG